MTCRFQRQGLDLLTTTSSAMAVQTIQAQTKSSKEAMELDGSGFRETQTLPRTLSRRAFAQKEKSNPMFASWLVLVANVTILCFFSNLCTPAYGAPLGKRDGGTVKVVVPIVVIVSVAAVIVVTVCVRNGLHTRLWQGISRGAAAFGPSTGSTTNTTNGTRELTAQQLLGPNGQAAATTAATRPARAGRRNRRTPSQISTRSLPMYMKEPGEQEVVIYRGPEDMEDMAPVTTNVVMPAVLEVPDASTVDLTDPRAYVPMPDSPNDMPLLAGDDALAAAQADITADNSRSNLLQTHRSRPSSSTLASSEERRSLDARLVTPDSDPRGDAPPYFEVVPLEELHSADSGLTPASTTGTDDPLLSHPDDGADHDVPEGEAQATVRHHGTSRLSGLFSIFHGRSASSSVPPRLPASPPEVPASTSSHRREDSDASLETSNIQLTRTRSRRAPSRSTMHRPSFSGSNSMFSVMTRSRSRLVDHSQNNLTSPSMVSVSSISAPLSHTLVRTEFTYPKTGPTPDQLKLISSREAFQRFGVPYGEEAIAFAASSSRVELPDVPPPEFEEIARTESRIIESPLARNEPVTAQEETSGSQPEASGSGTHDRNETQQQAQTSEAAASANEREGSVEHAGRQPEPPVASASTSAVRSTSPSRPPGLVSSIPESISAPEPSQPSSSKPSVSTEASTLPLPSTLPVRSESRASSVAISFATADESLQATPLPSPAPTPYASVSSRMTVPKVAVKTSLEVDHSADGDEEEDTGAATPHDPASPTTPHPRQEPISHSHEDTITTLTPTTTASTSPEAVAPPVVVAH